MTTSNSTNFSMTRNEIITDALQGIGVLGEDESPTSSAVTSANRALNRIVKAFENQSSHVWKKKEATLFLQMDQESYTLGGSSTDHATGSFVQTTLSGAEALGQTALSVTSSTGMTAADYVGIVLDDGSIHWTTISVVNSSVLITITLALASAAASGNVVYSYTTKILKPLKIYGVRRHNVSDDSDIAINELSYEDYMNLSVKTTSGTVCQYMYHRDNSDGTFYVWLSPDDADDVLKITYSPSFEDFDNTSDTPDFPQEWYDVLVLALEVRLARTYGKATGDFYSNLKADYNTSLATALAFDVEQTYITMVPRIK
jgi:hypothetical protein